MQERYALMTRLRDHLAELFELCGTPAEQVPVEPAPVPLRWLEALLRDRRLYEYLKGLDAQAEQAIQTAKERNLDFWNAQENERILERQEEELRQLRQQLQDQASQPTPQVSTDAGQLAVVQDIIAMRDNLMLRKNWIQNFAPDEKTAAQLVDGQLQETAKLLERAGVEIMDRIGSFDCRLHAAVETRPALYPEQDGQIAETFRPGYRFRGEVLRPQEVILYIKNT